MAVTWDDAQQFCQDVSSDTDTTTTLPFFKRSMNHGYKQILSQLNRAVTERTLTAVTVASQQNYQVPPDYLFAKSVNFTPSGGQKYPLIPVESQDHWDILNSSTTSGNPTHFFVKPRVGYSGGEILLFPTPSAAGDTITMIYEATRKDLTADKYTTGTVAVTEDSVTVTGTGTSWTSAMVGRYIKITDGITDGFYYRIVNRPSSSVLTLENFYEGSTGSSLTYEIAELFDLPEEMQLLPTYYALWLYYHSKQDEAKAREFRQVFDNELELARRRHAEKTRSQVMRSHRQRRTGLDYPQFWPSNGIS